jgi:hydrogenase expression/formation protein HypC
MPVSGKPDVRWLCAGICAAGRKGKMCVGLSAKVVSVKDDMAIVDASGARRKVSAALLQGLAPGDYVMVHAGTAIARITDDDEDESGALLGLL